MSTPTDEEAQQDEMLAMESILEGDAFQLHSMPGDIRSGQIKVRLDLPDPFFIGVDVEVDPRDEDLIQIPGITTGAEARYQVEFLPPLMLHFTLPKNYPSLTKPNFTLSATWLHRIPLSLLCKKLDHLWDENKGMGILFTWSNYLQANSLTDLGIHDFYQVGWIHKPIHLAQRKTKLEHLELNNTDSSAGDPGNSTALSEGSNGAPTDQPEESLVNDVNTNETTERPAEAAGVSCAGPSRPTKFKKRKKSKKGKVSIDQRAALDAVPRKNGKDVSLIDFLLSFNDELIQETFQQSTHSCDICFTLKVGLACLRFHCGHVFCRDCVCTCFTTHIAEGNVDQVKCPAFNCKIRPSPEVVRKLVGEALYERYDEILLKRALESMADVTYCPRPKCHNPVMCDPNDNCASCAVCGHTFCHICKMVYHGVEPCRFKNVDMKEVFQKYTQGSADEKKALLRAYGEKQLKILCENVLSEQWIQKESKQCPHCRSPIEKFEGCNKVTCFKCNTYFCWLCLKQLEHGNPYFHFNDPNSRCYNNLFQDIEAEDAAGNEWLVGDDSDTSEDDDDYLELVSDADDDDYEGFLDDVYVGVGEYL